MHFILRKREVAMLFGVISAIPFVKKDCFKFLDKLSLTSGFLCW